MVMYTIMNEALAKFGVDIATSVSVSAFSAMNIVHHGTEEQKDRYLSRVVNGEIRFSISITEPNAGSDAASLATSARLDGDHFFFDANPTRKSTGTCIMRASIRGSFSTNSIVLLSISIMPPTEPISRGFRRMLPAFGIMVLSLALVSSVKGGISMP